MLQRRARSKISIHDRSLEIFNPDLSGRHRGIASPVFSHRGGASQRISAARTRIARIFASHRIASPFPCLAPSPLTSHRCPHRATWATQIPTGRDQIFSIPGPSLEGNCESKISRETVGIQFLPRGIKMPRRAPCEERFCAPCTRRPPTGPSKNFLGTRQGSKKPVPGFVCSGCPQLPFETFHESSDMNRPQVSPESRSGGLRP